jgi:hypothetical protein
MATLREQIAQHTRAEATQQQPIADDPLAPTPIRFTHWHDADGVIHQRTVNEPTAGWHLEDDAEASDAEPLRRSAMRYQHTRPAQYRGRLCCPLPRSACAASVSLGMRPVHRNALPGNGASIGRCTW